MFRPVMRMGFIGFTDESRLLALLAARQGICQWRRGPFVESDALWVNGERAQLVRGRLVRVPSGDPTRPATLLDLNGIDRPTAFALPVGSADIHPPAAFDPRSQASVDAVLSMFEFSLQSLAAELVLAHRVADNRSNLSGTVYHLMLRNVLIGVVNLDGDVGLMPAVTPGQVAAAEWTARPAGANNIPAHFSRLPITQLMWQYAVRSDEELLPRRYRDREIYFRGPPQVPQRLLRDTHMVLLGQLHAQPQTFAQLKENTGLADHEVAAGLGALYFAGSITTKRGRSAVQRTSRMHDPGVPSSLLDTDAPAAEPTAHDLTVPAALEMRPRH